MRKRAVKRQSRKPIFYGFAVLFAAILLALIMDVKRTKKLDNGENNLDDNGDNKTEPFFNAFKSATERPPKPPLPQPKRIPAPKNWTHLQLNRVTEKPAIKINKIYFQLPAAEGPVKDWEDYEAEIEDFQRIGLGEQGVAAHLTNDSLKELEIQLSMENGFNALLSDHISVNRSVADVRDEM